MPPLLHLSLGEPRRLSLTRKLVLLVMFCFAQFLDTLNTAALFSAIPTIEASMGMSETQSTWVISAFRLTFSSFLLISGRLSDVYNPKTVFIGGVSSLGVLSLCAGFVVDTIPLLVVRAITGIASSMTIPSALKLLVRVFPDPLEQARAVGFFGGCGAVANVGGLVVGAVFVQWASYHWVFWYVACAAFPVALVCVFMIPSQIGETSGTLEPIGAKWKTLDLVGVGILTVAFILFIFSVTSGSTDGWKSPMVLVLLIISVLMVVGFFYWETLLPVGRAAIPPQTWFYNNFSVLFAVALMPYLWWNAVMLIFSMMWQNVFYWSAISSAVHMLPLGIIALAASFTGSLSRIFSPKWIILTSLSFCMVGTVLLALGGGRPENYWPYVFPAFVLGSAGVMMTFTHTNIAIFQAAPSSMSGTVGAMFNGALQLGSAIGLAASSVIETSVEATHGGSHDYAGRAASFWFLLGIVALQFILISIFYDRSTDHKPQPKYDGPAHSTQPSPDCDEKSDTNVTIMPEVN
ncbi:major facilitator superfamily domain-containing protein [Suillus clintonianus]|uniref:major facilitator superfamily domain-containing protein n=1 Tax=Suillus clintonianus TaxID=1904413 RepID=UPI001B866FC1|nr:major facilitator superfamily domain-containing protein [Suillus clintonianus]KAG2125506.1 major facilitator superfamily domain-containing protein [Suillus clintonianus]